MTFDFTGYEMDWAEEALCRDYDPKLFFSPLWWERDYAKAICAACPILETCREWALTHECEGVWGGTNEEDRRRIRREQGIRGTNVKGLGFWREDHSS